MRKYQLPALISICYAGIGHPLILYLEELGLAGQDPREGECPDYNIANAKIIIKVLMDSGYLKVLNTNSEIIQTREVGECPNFNISNVK